MWIKFSKLLLTIKNIALLGVGIALCIALVNSLINLGGITWANINDESTYYNLIEELITFFLYFANPRSSAISFAYPSSSFGVSR